MKTKEMTSNMLNPHHLEDLSKSGLSEETIADAKIRSFSAHEVAEAIGFNPSNSGGLAFPYYRPDGTVIDNYIRVKIDNPPIIDDKPARYLSRKNARNHIYIPPTVRESLADTSKAIYITEGEKKALKTAQEGLCCVAFPGVWCWKSRDDSGESRVIEDLNWIEWKDRSTFIIFDSDIQHNPSVREAEKALAQELTDRAASVRSIRLPEKDDAKIGLDDYLVDHTVIELLQLPQIDPLDEKPGKEKVSKDTQSTKLVEYASDFILFHDQYGEPFAFINGEAISMNSRRIKQWLSRKFYLAERKAPGLDAINQALMTLEAKAIYVGEEIQLHNRIARHQGSIWYDLGTGKAVKISPGEWEVVDAPILFRRHSHQKPQTTPVPGGDPNDIFRFLNVREDQRLLLLAYLISCFIPDIPHPIFHPYGPHGAGKSSACVVIKKLCDPSKTNIIIFPKEKTELVQVLAHNHVCIFDNMSDLPDWMSDIFCMACSGAGFSKRQLFTDDEDIIYEIKRCIGLSGINLLTVKPDIMDRSILLHLDRIAGNRRREEGEHWGIFEEAKPGILGGIFDVLAKAMASYRSVHLPYLPRMADFGKWGYAIAEALGLSGSDFLLAYQNNIDNQNEEVVQGNSLAQGVMIFMAERESWNGTVKQAHEELLAITNPEKYDPTFPKSNRSLRKHLERIKANLLDYGISYTIGARSRDGYPISIRKGQNFGSFGSLDSQALVGKDLAGEPSVNEGEANRQPVIFDSPPNHLKDNMYELDEPNEANYQTLGGHSAILPGRFDDLPPDVQEKVEERAAIMEFEGGLSRKEAELAALILAGEPT